MATHFRNSRWRRPRSWILVYVHFRYDSCVLWRILNIPTIFSEHWSISKEMATHFRNSGWRRPPSWNFEMCIFDRTVAFYGRFTTFLPNLVRIGPIVYKWLPIFEIQDGGGRHLEFWYMCIFDMTFAFYGRFSTFLQTVVRIGQILKKWQHIFEIQVGGGSHLENTLPVEPPVWDRNS